MHRTSWTSISVDGVSITRWATIFIQKFVVEALKYHLKNPVPSRKGSHARSELMESERQHIWKIFLCTIIGVRPFFLRLTISMRAKNTLDCFSFNTGQATAYNWHTAVVDTCKISLFIKWHLFLNTSWNCTFLNGKCILGNMIHLFCQEERAFWSWNMVTFQEINGLFNQD